MQGYVGLDDAALRDIGPWTRLAPGICMAWTAVGTLLASPALIASLAPIAALGALLPWHPFDFIYNYGIRRLTGTRPLPRHGAPRRFACAVATMWLAAIAWAFASGAAALGYGLGGLMVLAASSPTFTDFCIPSFLYGKLVGARMDHPVT